MVAAATTTRFIFDLQPGDVYWCTADCGWITGHSYLAYGPLLCGAQSVVFEGVPSYPTPARCWQIVEKYKVRCPGFSFQLSKNRIAQVWLSCIGVA